ncbi:MAG: glycosyltransferase family 39 protein [Acidimicrobiales bacterium]
MTTTDRGTQPPALGAPSRKRSSVWVIGVVGTTVVYFVTMACLWLNRPGLYIDEANFVDAALGGHFPHQLYVNQRIDGIPLLIIPYIGTVKAAIFAPIFAVFGVSVSTIRIPAIVLSATTLVVAYFVGREIIGRWSAVLVVIMGTCPTFIFMSKVDWGPIVVAMCLSMALLLAFFKYLDSGRIAWMWTFFAFALVGVFDKQNFLWLIVGVGVGGSVVYRKRLGERAREHPRATFFAVASFASCLLLFGLVFVVPNLSAQGSSSLQDPIPNLAFAWGLFQRTIGYSAVIGFFTGRNVSQPVWMDFQWVFSVAAMTILALRRRGGPLPESAVKPARGAVFFLVVFVVMIVEVAATKQATGPWHVIELMPYTTLILLCSLVAVWRSGSEFRTASSVIAATGLCVILAGQAVATSQYVALMQNPGRFRAVLSTAVYHDSAYLNSNAEGADEIVSAGWGPGIPLFSLACSVDRPKYRDDLWIRLVRATPTTAPDMVRDLFGDKRILLVSVHDAASADLTSDLYADTRLLEAAYASAFPGRHPQQVLTTSAYDITYFGPQRFQGGRSDC